MDIVNAHQGYHVSKAFTRPLSKNAFASCFQEPAANSTPNPRWVLPGLPSPEELLEISQSWASPGNPRQSFLWQHCLNMYKCTPMLLRQGAGKASQPVQLGCAGNPLSLYLPCHPALAMSKTHVGQWEEWKSWRPREGTSCLSGHQFEYTRISAASWIPTVSDDNVNDVAICQRATLSVQKAEWLPLGWQLGAVSMEVADCRGAWAGNVLAQWPQRAPGQASLVTSNTTDMPWRVCCHCQWQPTRFVNVIVNVNVNVSQICQCQCHTRRSVRAAKCKQRAAGDCWACSWASCRLQILQGRQLRGHSLSNGAQQHLWQCDQGWQGISHGRPMANLNMSPSIAHWACQW